MPEKSRTAKRVGSALLIMGLGQGAIHPAWGEEVTVTGRVVMARASARAKAVSPADAVVWLTALSANPRPPAVVTAGTSPRRFRLIQKNKRFEPHLLVVPQGSVVDFPNNDPVFHNVFSLFEGKRFDLGLYEAGSMRVVSFDRPGVCYIFCNIHPDMSAVVIVLATPYYATTNQAGMLTIPNVPAGRYRLQVWYERCVPEFLESLTSEIEISADNSTLRTLQLVEAAGFPLGHSNKYGYDYETPTPRSPLYPQP